MSRKTREFQCDCGYKAARLVYDDVTELECPECKGTAKRKLSAPAGSGNSAHGFLNAGKRLI